MEIKIFSKWRPSAILNLKNFDFLSNLHARNGNLYLCTKFAKFRLFVKRPSWESKSTSAYQIWSKSINSRLRYGYDAIFKMAAVRHLEFAKIAVLVTWPISACDPSFLFQISCWSANMAPRYSQKRFSIWCTSTILSLKNYDFLLNVHHGNSNLHLPTKFDQNRLILGWDMDMMLFSKWRPSAILNLRKLQFWSRDLYRHVIQHLCSKFRVDRPIWRRDIAKKLFSIWRPSAILDLLWRHLIASVNCILLSQLCVKFSRRSVS